MREFLEKVPVFVIVVVVVSIVRALMRATKGRGAPPPLSPAGVDETEDQKRVREIQERIRRIAAERRGGAPIAPPPSTPPPLRVPEKPRPLILQPDLPVPPIDPFGGPARRMREEVLKRLRPATTETPPPLVVRKAPAEAERQEQLRDQMRALEEKKYLAERQAQHLAEARQEEAESEAALRTTARSRLLEDLRDPTSLRRAFVLREVLGAPVGLR